MRAMVRGRANVKVNIRKIRHIAVSTPTRRKRAQGMTAHARPYGPSLARGVRITSLTSSGLFLIVMASKKIPHE